MLVLVTGAVGSVTATVDSESTEVSLDVAEEETASSFPEQQTSNNDAAKHANLRNLNQVMPILCAVKPYKRLIRWNLKKIL
tara:strand:+ start:220 stop:462 length:243 start_codon:yes stop_codon:yes gene_type:complete